MSPLPRTRKQQTVITVLLLSLILACGPLDRLREQNQQRQALATGAAIIDQNNRLAADAYKKIQTLPSYRLESRSIRQDSAGNRTSQVIISEYDAQRNRHTLTQAPNGQEHEVYFVDGHTYVFDPQYEGWLDLGAVTPAEAQQRGESVSPVSPGSVESLVQLLTQFAVVPIEAGHEILNNRPATRYELQFIMAQITEAFGREPTDPSMTLRGMLWVDDATGALLKSEFLLYEGQADQPTQEYLLEVSEIGNIAPITVPAPVVDPEAIAAATATAQAWTVLKGVLDYQGKQINFELIPVRATQVPDSSPRSARIQLILRQLPESLFLEAELEPFLIQLREKLLLSIPKRNLVVTSSGFRLENSDSQNRTLEVLYFFNADLEDFDHVELIFSRPGNPLFAPVPVE